MKSFAKLTKLTKLSTFLFFMFAFVNNSLAQGQNDRGQGLQIAKPNVEPEWRIQLVDHPQISDEFGDITLKGDVDTMRTFFRSREVLIRPESKVDTRRIDSFF